MYIVSRVRAKKYLTKGTPTQTVLRPVKDGETNGTEVALKSNLAGLSPTLAGLSRQAEPGNRTPVSASLG